MDRTIDWLRSRPYYRDQIEAHRTVDACEASTEPVDLDERIEDALADRGIDELYGHQVEAIEAVRDGTDVVLATPTASGKSLAYAVPVLERALDRRGTALYVAPQVALINDQADTLGSMADDLGFASGARVDRYTGRLDRTEKKAVRDRQPTILLTTPDMLHYGILPHAHRLWAWFFERLETVVIDEVHEYRGVFGSHVSLVCRRLNRLCERFGADPEFVCCSATIANPGEHAAAVTGRGNSDWLVVDRDDSASGPRHWLFWNPPEYEAAGRGSGRRRSGHGETMRLFVDLVARGHQTVVFTRARQTAERYATESAAELRDRGHKDLAASVTAYQAALGRERRKEIETGLHDGSVRGVWSTNALELGVDIGGLDAVLLDGYPGTRMATRQQAGRAGRGTDPALVGLVAGEDQLDQYVMAHPDDTLDGPPEQAVVNPRNDSIRPDHARAAAQENWLSPADSRHFGDDFPEVVAEMVADGLLERRSTAEGVRWIDAGDGSPQQALSLRTIDDREIVLRDRSAGERIATLPFSDALRDAHPGAIYHHQGRTYEVTDLDLDGNVAILDPTQVNYHTRVLHEKEIDVETDRRERSLETEPDVPVRFADVTLRKQITGYERRNAKRGTTIGRESLDLPETELATRALYFTVPPTVQHDLERRTGSFPGAIHAAEHALISLFPTAVLCDRRDVGGLSTPQHGHTGRSTIFVYDGYPGGVGLARGGYEQLGSLLDRTRDLLASCDCADGCPACVQSPHCGNANEPLDKAQALSLLESIRGSVSE